MKKRIHTLRWLFLFTVALFLNGSPAFAQLIPRDTAATNQPVTWNPDSLGRRTPRGTVEGFIRAVAQQNYVRASHYLRLDSTLKDTLSGVQRAQALQRLLDKQGNLMPTAWLSDNPDGLVGDNLGPNLDRIGTAKVNEESFDLMVEKTEGADGGPIWLFSSQTIQRIPLNVEAAVRPPLVTAVAPDVLKETKWNGVPIGHWIGIVILAVLAYLVSWSVISVIRSLILRLWHKAASDPTAGIIRAFALPIRLYLAVWLFVMASQQVGISIIVRQQFSQVTVIVGLASLLLLVWQLIDVIADFSQKQLTHLGNMAGVSAALFLRRAAKTALVVVGAIIVLDTIGFDVTTGLAALGIGGIALALGAQKTVENFVGSVTLIADQPVRVGDFCKVGDIVGTVEQIGMRSTRIRTLDRTIVTIPNGEFSSLKIENYAHRDRFWFHPAFGLRFETTPEQIRYLLVQLRSILYAHPKVSPDPARIRFVGLGADALKLEIFAYVIARDFDEFLEVQEDLLLRIMDAVNESGTGFAFPSQTLYLARDRGVSKEKTQEAEETVRSWRDAGTIQLPRFDQERIAALRNTIPYPPEGSSQEAVPRKA